MTLRRFVRMCIIMHRTRGVYSSCFVCEVAPPIRALTAVTDIAQVRAAGEPRVYLNDNTMYLYYYNWAIPVNKDTPP